MLVCLAAFVCAIWALATRRKRIGRSAIAILMVALNLFRPVSPPMQPIPPVAVEAAAARRLVGLGPVQPVVSFRTGDASTRYVLAQIAYVEGDRAGARRLWAGLNGRDLESPIEAPFRLQFLQGRPVWRSAVCTTTGCFPEPVRALLAAIAAFAALALAGAAAAAWEVAAPDRRALQADRGPLRSAHRSRHGCMNPAALSLLHRRKDRLLGWGRRLLLAAFLILSAGMLLYARGRRPGNGERLVPALPPGAACRASPTSASGGFGRSEIGRGGFRIAAIGFLVLGLVALAEARLTGHKLSKTGCSSS